MAVTRIWAVKDNLSRVLDYAANKNKTDLSKYADLIDTLHYAADEEKTNLENEQKLLVEGINCDPDIAVQQMIDTKELYGKTDGVLAYHAYISFKPGEVSPEEAQQVATEVADKMWGKDYELIVATHLNANCVHCHIVINSVSITDGRKMNEDKAMYYEFRRTSDAVCREHELSVIEKPKGKRIPYNIYKAKQKGIKTKYDYMCEDLDYAIEKSHNEQIFFKIMSSKHQGKTYGQNGHKLSRDEISDTESGRTVQRYIRLTYLIPDLLKLVDEGRIGISPAVELSYFPEELQKSVYSYYVNDEVTPTVSQAQRIRKQLNDGVLTEDSFNEIMNELKPNQKESVRVPIEKVQKYFKSYKDPKFIEDFIDKAIKFYIRHLERQKDRDAR